MTDHQERILDSFLEEVVGEIQPSDFAPEILRKIHSPPPLDHLQGPLDQLSVRTEIQPLALPVRSRRIRKRSNWLPIVALVAGLALVALMVGLLATQLGQGDEQPVVEGSPHEPTENRVLIEPRMAEHQEPKNNLPGNNQPGDNQPSNVKPEIPDEELLVKEGEDIFSKEQGDTNSLPVQVTLPDVAPVSSSRIVAAIDDSLNRSWNVNHVSTTKPVPETVWARRVIFALTGRDATKRQIQAFERLPQQNRREEFLNDLFENDQIVDEFANLWARRLATAFLGETVSAEHQNASKFPAKAHLLVHFRYALYHGEPYHLMATNLLTAQGTIQPLDVDYDGASGYLILLGQQSTQDVTVATGKIGRAFLGQRMQCARCHDDQAAGLAQRDFWKINVLLRDFRIENATEDLRIVSKPVSQEPVFYENSKGVVLAEIAPLPEGGKSMTREILAQRLINSPLFRRNAVNIVWSELLGYGLVHPPADSGSHNDPLDANLLTKLGDQFAVHGYDIRKLISWIVMSQAFDRRSDMLPNDKPELGGRAFFARFYDRYPEKNLLSPARSLELMAKAHQSARDGRLNGSPREEVIGKIAPSPEKNRNRIIESGGHQLSGWAVSDSYAATLDSIAKSLMNQDQKVSHIYWLALSREPNRIEAETCRKLLESDPESQLRILQDIWWAITR